MSEPVRTRRLDLVPIAIEHTDLLVALDADPEVMRYLTGGAPSSRAEVEATIRRSIGHRWTAFEAGSERFVGWFGLRPSGDAEAELGYRLGRAAWGLGYASEGSRALLDVGFAGYGLRRIWAQTMAVNERSRRVMEACGMRFVRTFHLDWTDPIEGAEAGEVEYEVLLTDYFEQDPG